MSKELSEMTRRGLLRMLGAGSGALALGKTVSAALPGLALALARFPGAAAFAERLSQQEGQPAAPRRLATFTGPGANPYWNSVGPMATYPQKAPLVLLTDRPVQLETPRHYFLDAITPNDAFFVRWHLEGIPNEVDLKSWRLRVEGNVSTPLELSFMDLMRKFEPVTIAAVNQCSGNSRSRFTPRVVGGQWGNGAMGCARWTGARFREVLKMAGAKAGSVQVQMQGLERGKGPQGKPSYEFMKSLDLNDPALEEAIVAYSMNGEPLPLLNGFPVRLIVPGYFATYWVKCLSWVRLLDRPDENFWMNPGYRVPDTPRGTTTPEDVKAGKVKMIPITRMPVRSFVISPDGATKIPAGMTVSVRGIAFSGVGRVTKVEFSHSTSGGWREAKLGEDLGPYAFRTWEIPWQPESPGRYSLAARATDEKGNVQPDEGVWNPGGYLWNKIERQEVTVGIAS